MAMDQIHIEQMARELKCDAPRVTFDLIKSRIKEVDYQTVIIAGQKFMYCGIKMDNGFVVVGRPAACVDPANWRDEMGRKVSYDNSFGEIWKLEGYRLMSEPK
jgi:formylmethanofuran dehydrogenase subunit C